MSVSILMAAMVLVTCHAMAQESPPLPTQPVEVPPPPRQPAPASTQAGTTSRTDVIPKLTVRGEAELQKPADQLQLRLGVVTHATEAAQAMQENNRTMDAIIAAITKLGLDKKEYQTSRFTVHPQYAPPPRQPQPDWRPKITGYQVNNALLIKTTKLEQAGEIIQAATEAGANSIESIFFDLADPRTHRTAAIRTATINAISDAEALAQASGQRLIRVISITLDDAQQPQPLYREVGMERGMLAMDMATAPPINPGDITVRASVTVVYEIAPLN